MKNTGPGASPGATVDYELDNVRLYGEAAPMLAVGLTNITAASGGSVQLSVKAHGSQPMGYQWFFKGNPLPGTGPTLLLTDITLDHAGEYSVVIRNDFGSVTNSAFVSVLDLKMFAGLTLAGPVGASYRIEYRPALGGPETWQTLTTLTLSSAPTTWIDNASANQPKRFYRAIRLP